MDSKPRNWSRELPPNLSQLMDKLIKYANSFISEFDNKGPEMRSIVREFQEIVDKVKKTQERTNTARKAGNTVFLVGLFAAPFTGGLSLAAAAAGGGTVVGSNLTKMWKEDGSAEKVEKLGKKFMRIIEPQKKNLEEIKTTCKELEDRSAELQAKSTLREVEEFQEILRQISELKTTSEEVLVEVVTVIDFFHNLLVMIGMIFCPTATPEDDQRFRASIIKSGDQCQRVVNQFGQMKMKLIGFRGN